MPMPMHTHMLMRLVTRQEGVWEALDKKTIADIVLCYGILKGLLQVCCVSESWCE
jgi:hypothetical protein